MKSLLLFFTLLVGCGYAAETAKRDCCAACCTNEKPASPLAARSLYQLDATFTDDSGRTIFLAQLRDRPVVLAMFFANCEYACPVIVDDMKRLRAALPEDQNVRPRFVLVTFDTARDTVANLRAYRERMSLDEDWVLLRSDTSAVQELAMLLGIKFKQDDRGQFSHSNTINILNREGELVLQHVGLAGDISPAAKAVATLVRKP